MKPVDEGYDIARDIDVEEALKQLPGKIEERNKIITSIALDISCLEEAGELANPEEVDNLKKQLAGQRRFRDIYVNRLEAIQKAARGE